MTTLRKIVRAFKTQDIWGIPTWAEELVALGAFAVFFLVGLASNFYWGTIAGIASFIVWFVWRVKRP